MKQLCMTCGIRHEALANRCCSSFRPVSEISPTELHHYLRRRGWKPGRAIRGAGREVYENEQGRELCVPSEAVDQSDRSYPRAIELTLDRLAEDEGRSVLDIVDELRPDIPTSLDQDLAESTAQLAAELKVLREGNLSAVGSLAAKLERALFHRHDVDYLKNLRYHLQHIEPEQRLQAVRNERTLHGEDVADLVVDVFELCLEGTEDA